MSISQYIIDKHQAYASKQDEALKRHKRGESWKSICNDYGFDPGCFTTFLAKNGLYAKKQRSVYTNIKTLKKIKEEYESGLFSISQLAKKYGIYRHTLSQDLKQAFNISVLQDGKKQIDDHYFDIIDTPQKAYWLGFLYADGYNSGDGDIELALQEQDVNHIKKFANAIKSKHCISYRKKVKAYRISIHSNIMSKALNNYGCVNHKSYCMRMPAHLCKELLSHFIRGYFDGDGCFYTIKVGNHRNGRITFTTGSFDFVNDFIDVLDSFDIKAKCWHIKRRKNWTINILKQEDIEKFYQLIYANAFDDIWLTRKYKKFNSWIMQKYFAV